MNEIVFAIERYGGDREKMFAAVAKQLAILMDNEYMCKFYDDDTDIIVIQYNYDTKKDPAWGGDELEWLTPEEMEVVENYREEHKNKE